MTKSHKILRAQAREEQNKNSDHSAKQAVGTQPALRKDGSFGNVLEAAKNISPTETSQEPDQGYTSYWLNFTKQSYGKWGKLALHKSALLKYPVSSMVLIRTP